MAAQAAFQHTAPEPQPAPVQPGSSIKRQGGKRRRAAPAEPGATQDEGVENSAALSEAAQPASR